MTDSTDDVYWYDGPEFDYEVKCARSSAKAYSAVRDRDPVNTRTRSRQWLESMADRLLVTASADVKARTPLIGETEESRRNLALERRLRGEDFPPEGYDADDIGYDQDYT